MDGSTSEELLEALRRLGEGIRERREARGLTLRDLAIRTGIPIGRLSAADRGETSLNVTDLIRIARAVRTTPGRLLVGIVVRAAWARMPLGGRGER